MEGRGTPGERGSERGGRACGPLVVTGRVSGEREGGDECVGSDVGRFSSVICLLHLLTSHTTHAPPPLPLRLSSLSYRSLFHSDPSGSEPERSGGEPERKRNG